MIRLFPRLRLPRLWVARSTPDRAFGNQGFGGNGSDCNAGSTGGAPASSAVHADPNAMLFKNTCEGLTGELDTLISIEDFWRSVALQGLLQGIDTEVCVHGVGDPPGQHLAAVPVDNGDQVHEAPGQRNIADICCPHLVWAIDLQALEQVRIHLAPVARNAGSGARIHRLNVHGAHQALNPLAVYPVALAFQVDPHLTGTVVRRFQVLLINQIHQFQILLTLLTGDVVHRRAAQLEQLTLARNADVGMTTLDHRQPLLTAY